MSGMIKQDYVIDPISQLFLYNYEKYFNYLLKLHQNNNLPKINLFYGEKGIGKCTFAFHFINYLLSQNEKYAYSLKNFEINYRNKSFRFVNNNLHPNFYLINKISSKKSIEIEQIRNLFNFLNKTTYVNNIKIILIIDSENLNNNASNALLKSLEEPSPNTFFFLIQNSSLPMIETIKSRCHIHKIFYDNETKKKTLLKLLEQFDLSNPDLDYFDNEYVYLTPGTLINYIRLKSIYKSSSDDIYTNLINFIDIYLKVKNREILTIISFLIEYIYHQLFLRNPGNLNIYFNKRKITNNIFLMKKYNLDERNILSEVKSIIENEKR